MAVAARVTTALVFVLPISLAAARAVHGDVPTLADFAACNAHGRDAGSAVPTGADHARADRARAVATAGSAVAPASVVASADPQIHGMESEGAKDARYQALYRSCMRRKGF
jgi:hypothetical protein